MLVIAWVKDRSVKSAVVLMAPLYCIVPNKIKNSSVYSWVGDTNSGSMSIIRASIALLIDSKLSLSS